MAQFDVYPNRGRNRADIPFLIDVQSRRYQHIGSRLVVPVRVYDPREFSRWQAVVTIGDGDYLVLAHEMFAAPLRMLAAPQCSVQEQAQTIINAIDDVITTFYG